ncbi:EAL domain-containing protein [Qipengyuania sphaerica]|uniref:EAL domain-containing protein n=1 Tax=Qipengyuania sphaerica TaxID=2867243 RepID=UPI001C888971|nr:EAL domain-containing protein [Qipengyuania sphaerica]MBX7539862.1 EAL domain-containing protein [Qipengyuania sphaerica]
MNAVRALTSAGTRLKSLVDLPAEVFERLKSLFWAGLLAFVLFLIALLEPVDQVAWMLQSRIVDRAPSGDIVFVAAERDMADPNLPQRREELAEALTELERRGVGKVYLDITIPKASSSSDADRELGDAIAALGPRAAVVNRLDYVYSADGEVSTTLPEIAGSARQVVSERRSNFMGFAWTRDYGHEIDGRRYPSLAASLGGIEDSPPGEFQIDYAIPFEKIEVIDLADVSPDSELTDLAGKTVIIGEGAVLGEGQQRIPGKYSVPYSYVAIYGAETLKAGRTRHLSALPALVIFLLLLAAGIVAAKTPKRREAAYLVMGLSIPVTLYVGAYIGVRMDPAYCVATLLAYIAIRSRARWKNRIALVDNETGLPKLRALELKTSQDIHARGHLVVARIHGYEHVLKTLPRSERAQYILKLVDRLRATDGNLTIYSEGHHLAWHSKQDDSAILAEHLEGLRAMFAAPVNVAGSSVDVGISFGVAKLDGDPAARLAAAVAAAEESSEALQPIKIAESSSRFDELWDISLRARIDEAMSAGEIFCVYQPKIDTRSGTMTGVEALVRWQDPARGFIPPMHFIAQCEKAGRMEALTDYVFEHALAAGRLMHFRGRSISMSVNISATLLADMRVVGMVRNALQATGFDPRFLILEVTETSRIGNLETAEMVLNELRGLGARISMDDFGVGETNFETLFELPFDEVKIDRLFIANMAKSAKAKAIVSSIVTMGRDARIGVVAEGAEDNETLKMLTEIGCTHVQGYVLARPMSLDNLMEFNNLKDGGAQQA